MLRRLHASKVSDGCVASFVPCTSASPKPSPGPFFNVHVCFKRGWRRGGVRGGNTSVFQVGAHHLFPEFCCHSGRRSAAQVLKQQCVCMRGGGRRHSSAVQRVLYGQDEYVSPSQ